MLMTILIVAIVGIFLYMRHELNNSGTSTSYSNSSNDKPYVLDAPHPHDYNRKQMEEFLASISSKEAEQYLIQCNQQGIRMRDHYAIVAEKAGEQYEDMLLGELEDLDPSEISGWIRNNKKIGYYMTNLVYDAAMLKKEGVKQKRERDEDEWEDLD